MNTPISPNSPRSTFRPRFAGAALVLFAAVASMGGCYKTEADTQKARADKAEAALAETNAKLEASNKKAADAQAIVARVQRARLVTIIDGKPVGSDEIALTASGEFVRSGNRIRPTSTIRYDNGKIADQPLSVTRDNGKLNFTGAVRNSRPEGDWIWFDKDGRPSVKEVWKDGKLSESAHATAIKPDPAKGDQVTWKTMARTDRDKWLGTTAVIFANIPELIREAGAAPEPKKEEAKKAPAKATPKKR